MSSLSQRRSAMAIIVGSAAMAAILLASAHAARADNIPFNLSSKSGTVYAYAVTYDRILGIDVAAMDGPDGPKSASSPVVDAFAQAGDSYAHATTSYDLSNGNTVLTLIGGVTACQDSSDWGTQGTAEFECMQHLNGPTLVHVVGWLNTGATTDWAGRGLPVFGVNNVNLATNPGFGVSTFDKTIDMFAGGDLYIGAFVGTEGVPSGTTGFAGWNVTVTLQSVPEPGALALLGTALLGLVGAISLRRRLRTA